MHVELFVDNFAGGGGASEGIKQAIGRDVDIAINHDIDAIRMHKTNHPNTRHYLENVWDINPKQVCGGRPVALAWFSPDCKHFSKAKGGKPVDKNIRSLAWVALRWAATVRPRMLIIENVPEFSSWGPLLENGRPDPKRKGHIFNTFINAFKKHGYKVEYKNLVGHELGAPTSRKRFFIIARCDGRQIIWPQKTHEDPRSKNFDPTIHTPWITVADFIDFSIPTVSIFGRKKQLAENTLKKIALGYKKFIQESPDPFIVPGNHELIAPYIIQLGQQGFSGNNRCSSIEKPISTIVSKAEHILVTPFLIQYHGEKFEGEVRGQNLQTPIMNIDTSNRYGLVASYLVQLNKSVVGQQLDKPINTITAGGLKFAEVRAFLISYYGSGGGQELSKPIRTITSKDRFALITIKGVDYACIDIGMRMLTPRELFRGHGFSEKYIIEHDFEGKEYTKKQQVNKVGNSVPPAFAKTLVELNLPEFCKTIKSLVI